MGTKLSTKGQVVLPSSLRSRLGLKPGDPLDIELDGDRIVLIPRKSSRASGRIVTDEVTGLPVFDAGEDAPPLTDEQVKALLADFP